MHRGNRVYWIFPTEHYLRSGPVSFPPTMPHLWGSWLKFWIKNQLLAWWLLPVGCVLHRLGSLNSGLAACGGNFHTFFRLSFVTHSIAVEQGLLGNEKIVKSVHIAGIKYTGNSRAVTMKKEENCWKVSPAELCAWAPCSCKLGTCLGFFFVWLDEKEPWPSVSAYVCILDLPLTSELFLGKLLSFLSFLDSSYIKSRHYYCNWNDYINKIS